jgi:hypothetical protein
MPVGNKEMLDRLLIEDLAEALPEYWEGMIARAAIVDEYIARPRRGEASPDKFAARLQISARSFLRLVARRRDRVAGREASWWLTGLQTSTSEVQEAIVRDAISKAGPGARRTEVRDHAHRLAQARGQMAPTDAVIYSRCAKHRTDAAAVLRCRLNVTGGVVLDACRLGVLATDCAGDPLPIWLVAAIGVSSGAILAHRILRDEQIAAALPSLVLQVDEKLGLLGRDPIVLTPALLQHIDPEPSSRPIQLQRAAICDTEQLRATEALQAVFGKRIGRIAFRTSWRQPQEAAVSIEVLRTVLDHMINVTNDAVDPPSNAPVGTRGSVERRVRRA